MLLFGVRFFKRAGRGDFPSHIAHQAVQQRTVRHRIGLQVECTEKDVYVVYGSGTNEEYAFNGGFFITDATITAQQLTAKKDNADAQGVTVLVEGKTIRVVDTEYVDITVSASPAEGGTVTINSEATSTKQVAKDSEVTVVATPANGYSFVNWTDAGGNEVSTDATHTFPASESTSLVAKGAR